MPQSSDKQETLPQTLLGNVVLAEDSGRDALTDYALVEAEVGDAAGDYVVPEAVTDDDASFVEFAVSDLSIANLIADADIAHPDGAELDLSGLLERLEVAGDSRGDSQGEASSLDLAVFEPQPTDSVPEAPQAPDSDPLSLDFADAGPTIVIDDTDPGTVAL